MLLLYYLPNFDIYEFSLHLLTWYAKKCNTTYVHQMLESLSNLEIFTAINRKIISGMNFLTCLISAVVVLCIFFVSGVRNYLFINEI